MARNCYLVFVLALSAPGSCLADGIVVSVSGSINGTGTVGYVCSVALPCAGDVTASNSFTLMGTNTQQGDFSRSGSASATDPVFGLTDSLSAEVHQSVTVTSLPLGDLILLTFANFETPSGDLGGGAFSRTSFWSLSLDDDIAATFTLTTESLVTLGGAATPGFSPELLNSAGIPVYVFPTSGDFSTTPVSLGAGTYQLIYDFSGGVGGFGFNNSNTTQINVLSALVQAEVPEPRWPWAVLVLLVGLISFAHRRRRVLL